MTERAEGEAPIAAILIAGPTASGKSALALALARRFGGVVTNADALQVYADLDVLTARPPAVDLAAAPHALYGHVDGAAPYAVSRWLDDVEPLLAGARGLPVIVGGTGLYFDSLLKGLSTVPEVDPAIRARWRGAGPETDLHAELARRDPVMAAELRPSDPQRLMRALEVIESTGRSLAHWRKAPARGKLDASRALRIALAPDRAALDARIVRRLETMLASGAAEEAVALERRGLAPDQPVLKAIGVAAFSAYARGDLSREAALERARIGTRQYAKRQSTWFRNRMPDWLHVAPEDAEALALAEIGRRGLDVPAAQPFGRDGRVPT
ncbi:tRNA dimethylallyltransferase [Methylopila jiangsuensis]|uniref:tRNA dimethylallyltransferase n=1 Tax=Methylopila jiangsuensis TaxID=586230 RepID=A0A9W6JHK7_9HYPH|nr:tRNA (adenosine(37)-N6)-dimethylallyltransferase MiaA [Methylopila jiangsuensis]MDR6286478.1 tRNA dimethylallyltransferase [Methylopila jiangsuensis]GLK77182.1 tRNA dimethylallyltransferase [Methylopila jiangsuensis]